jgi:hypothetical protein
MDKGKGKATKPLTSRKSTCGKATPAKTIPSTSRKTPISKPTKPTRKSRAPINTTTREINIYLPTVKARHTRTLLYKRTSTKRERPRGIPLLLLLIVIFLLILLQLEP